MTIAAILLAIVGQTSMAIPCPDGGRLTTGSSPAEGVRPLGAEPPARHIAAVDARRNGCPAILVLDEGKPAWRIAPNAAREAKTVQRRDALNLSR